MQYLTYYPETGSIHARIKSGYEPERAYGLDWIIGEADPLRHWIDAGQIVEREDWSGAESAGLILPSDEPQTIVNGLPANAWVSVRGTGTMAFAQGCYRADEAGLLTLVASEAGTYVVTLVGRFQGDPIRVEVITLDTLKERRRDEVEAYRASIATFPHMGHVWDFDETSESSMTRAMLRATAVNYVPLDFAWTDANNENVSLTFVEFHDLNRAMADFSNTVHLHARSLKDQINACSTVAAVLAINVSEGWPA